MANHCTISGTASLATLLVFFAPAPLVCADIFQWEYINPADPSQGKQQSATLAPDGAGVNAVPGADLSNRNLTMAYLIGAILSPSFFCDEEGCTIRPTDLTGATLAQADLTNAWLPDAILAGANLTGAEVRGVNFGPFYFPATGLTVTQLYSTASYQAHDLSGIGLGHHNLAGMDLSGQNLTNASFASADLTGANLTGAEVRGADFAGPGYYGSGGGITLAQLYSTASYQAHDLTGINLSFTDLSGVNLSGQNLTNANLGKLTDANLSGAEVRGASFDYNFPITIAQLSSTASYQAHDLSGVSLPRSNLTGANLAGFNLANARFNGATLSNADFSQVNLVNADFSYFAGTVTDLTGANLSGSNLTGAFFFGAVLIGANLRHANLTNADFSGDWYYDPGADLRDADLSNADARGPNLFFTAEMDGANTSNLIQAFGHIVGLHLAAGDSLIVRNYHGPAAPRIVVEERLTMDASSTLRLVFDADPWDSTISFAPDIPVALGGTLELTFAADIDIATQIGRTIDLFDWSGVTPIGAFTISSPYTWDVSNLYTTGEVTLTAAPQILPGDFNNDGRVDAADYVLWRKTGATQDDYNTWRANFGRTAMSGAALAAANTPSAGVPEPAGMLLLTLGSLAMLAGYHKRTRVATNKGVSSSSLTPVLLKS